MPDTPEFDRAAAEAELAEAVARVTELRELLADHDRQRRRQAAHELDRRACSWCGAPNARPELDRTWTLTGRSLCCPQGTRGCPCRLARMIGQSPEEFQAELLSRELPGRILGTGLSTPAGGC